MVSRTWVAALVGIALLAVGCQTAAPPSDPVPANPDQAVAELRAAWESAPGGDLHGTYSTACGTQLRSRALIRRQAENLVFRHPNHAPAQILCGVLAYEAGDSVAATRFLDAGLRLAPASADAVALRARIALEDGNPMFARKLLNEQVMLSPAHAGLRELQASTSFMEGDLDGARAALDAAEQLGAPAERIAYNRGLLLEEEGLHSAAIEAYQQAIELAPGWTMAADRLAGLQRAPLGQPAGAGPVQVPTSHVHRGFPPPAPPPPPMTSEIPLRSSR